MNKTFDKFFWISLFIFLLLVIGICFLPSILTGEGEPDFSQKGQIGDTIGGIMGPFVAIIAAWLTFIAFWVQFKANNQQRRDIAIERFALLNNLRWKLLADFLLLAGLVWNLARIWVKYFFSFLHVNMIWRYD